MLNENIQFDFKKLHQALSSTYKRQMEIKKEFPHRFEYPSWNEYSYKSGEWKEELIRRRPWREARSEFNRLSDRMTMLCCIINHAKGKLHMTQYLDSEFTRERQADFINPAYKEFVLEEENVKQAA